MKTPLCRLKSVNPVYILTLLLIINYHIEAAESEEYSDGEGEASSDDETDSFELVKRDMPGSFVASKTKNDFNQPSQTNDSQVDHSDISVEIESEESEDEGAEGEEDESDDDR